jgi:hypothetical protein
MPRCDTEAMNLHLAEIATQIAPGAHAAILVDQAGWHLSGGLNVPANITLIALSAKCPELNPQGPVATCVGIDWRVFGRHEAIRSCGEVNDLIVWFLGEGLPSVDLAHGDLS